MGTSAKLSIVALAVGVAACGGKQGDDVAKQDEFRRDLQLASSTNMDLAAPKVDAALLTLETKPQGAPDVASILKKKPGNRAVHSATPTVQASPEQDVAAVDENTDETQTVETAPAPVPTNEPVAVAPRPSPVPVVVQSGNGSGDYGTSGNGGGIFGPGGGIGGIIIRGGGVDGDHCVPRDGRRGGVSRGPIYVPSGGGTRYPTGTSGGVIGTRRAGGFPILPMRVAGGIVGRRTR